MDIIQNKKLKDSLIKSNNEIDIINILNGVN